MALEVEYACLSVIAIGKRGRDGFALTRVPRKAMQREQDIQPIRPLRLVALGGNDQIERERVEMVQPINGSLLLKILPLHGICLPHRPIIGSELCV